MAQALIQFTDLDINAGTVSTNVEVHDTLGDDGHMTMAHVFAKFIASKMNDAAFLTEVYEFAADLVTNEPAYASDESEAAVAA